MDDDGKYDLDGPFPDELGDGRVASRAWPQRAGDEQVSSKDIAEITDGMCGTLLTNGQSGTASATTLSAESNDNQ